MRVMQAELAGGPRPADEIGAVGEKARHRPGNPGARHDGARRDGGAVEQRPRPRPAPRSARLKAGPFAVLLAPKRLDGLQEPRGRPLGVPSFARAERQRVEARRAGEPVFLDARRMGRGNH